MAVDSSGNLYISDYNDYCVRKVNTAGIITTVAGIELQTGYSGDGGPATKAQLTDPEGLAVDNAGNLYIADGSRVRKVSSNGVITTVAGNGNAAFAGDGGPAISASMTVRDVAVDSTGNLYIADANNMRVRKVDTAGIITTVAGNGSNTFSGDGGPATGASLNSPKGVALDRAGNLYIATFFAVRKVTASGTITTVAGGGTTGGSSGDGGLATKATIGAAYSVAVDGTGNLYIADTTGSRIRKVDTSGIITTTAGNGTGGFSGDGGPATAAALNAPRYVTTDAAGNIFIADTNNFRIRKVAAAPTNSMPSISANGVVNGASFQSGLVPGSWGTISGANLASVTDNWNNSIVNGKLPTTLDGVTVSVGGQMAYVDYINPGQINFLVPDVAPGPVPVTVTTSAGTSNTVSVNVSAYGPAFFNWPGNQVIAARQDFSLAVKNGTFAGTTTTPAKPGEVIILWGTGFGPTAPAAPTGAQVPGDQIYATMMLPTVTINNVSAKVYGAALAPGSAGLYQVAIEVPGSLTSGDWPVVASIGGVQSPATTVLSVQP